MRIRCQTCQTTVDAVPRRNVGCTCDPDAPTWCYIDARGEARGLSSAQWTVEPD